MEVPQWARLELLQAARRALPPEILVPPLRPYGELGLVCENLQTSGSYKVRATCHLLQSYDGRGLALASSGNFAIALAWAGRHYGVPTTAVMMQRSQPWKVQRVRDLGGRVILCPDSVEERREVLLQLAQEGLVVVDHLNDPQVLVGHATLGLDLAAVRPRQVLIGASTGGLLLGCALALKQILPEVRIIGVQPEGANALVQSFHSGSLCRVDPVVTECDALTSNRPGELPWQLAPSWVDDMVCVSEAEVRASVLELLQEAKLLVEPGGAVGLAAWRSGKVAPLKDTWVVLSGGNMAPARLAGWLTENNDGH